MRWRTKRKGRYGVIALAGKAFVDKRVDSAPYRYVGAKIALGRMDWLKAPSVP